MDKVVNAFNKKIKRLEKEKRALLPEKTSYQNLVTESMTRSDLKRKLEEMKRFTKRGGEEILTTSTGATILKSDLETLKKEKARVKANITREIKRLETTKPKISGKEQARTYAEMGDTDYLNLLAKRKALLKDIDKLSNEELDRLQKLVKKLGKNQEYMNSVFKDNYIKMLTDLGYSVGYDFTEFNKLKKRIKNLKPNEFNRLFKEDKTIRAILDYYPILNGSVGSININYIKEDVTTLYDNMIENLDKILINYE